MSARNNASGKIIEIFSSIQGEGLWVGKPQVFVRFHGCKLKCTYCDTPLTHFKIKESRVEFPAYSKQFETHPLEFSVENLDQQIARFGIQSLALTGGEPLEQADFIDEWLKNTPKKYEVLLETSGIETEALKKVISNMDMISLDLKIPSATGERALWNEHEAFLQVAQSKPHYAKIVFDEKITEDELFKLHQLFKKFPNLTGIFQPVSPIQKRDLKKCLAIFNDFTLEFPNRIRLIPQVHKFLSVL